MKNLASQYNLFAHKAGRVGTLWLMLLGLFLFSVVSDVAYGTANDTTEAIKVLLLVLIGIIGFLVFRSLLGVEKNSKPSFNKPALKVKRKTQTLNTHQELLTKEQLDKRDTQNGVPTQESTFENDAPQELIKSNLDVVVDEQSDESPVVITSQVISTRLADIRDEMRAVASTERATKQREFFLQEDKNDSKEYLGVNIIDIVKISERFAEDIRISEIQTLMQSDVHDEHIVAIWLLINKYKNADQELSHTLFNFYLENRGLVNNWDMIDLASRNILGAHIQKNTSETQGVVQMLLASDSLWDTRSALMSALPQAQAGELRYGFGLISQIADNQEELVQSAIGWVLKESYKQDATHTEDFIKKHFSVLSKQAIRIGTERMDKAYRKNFLRGEFEKASV